MAKVDECMAILKKPKHEDVAASAQLCLDNGDRLLEQKYDLEFREPSSTRFYMAMIAQEEFAKASHRTEGARPSRT